MTDVLAGLLEGNRRFRSGESLHRVYVAEDFERIEHEQKPKAAVIACADSRVDPLAIFDQGLGDLFVARVPGNVASETAQWVVELAISEFHVPLVVVLGHTGCLAVRRVMEGGAASPGGMLKSCLMPGVLEARRIQGGDAFRNAVVCNAKNAVAQLLRESSVTRRAVEGGAVRIVPMLYVMRDGSVELIGG